MPDNVDGFILDRIGQKHMLSLLAEIPGVLADLSVTLTRQDQHAKGPSISRGNNAQPLPFSIHASDAHEALHTELAHWARLTCRARKVGLPDRVDPLNLAVWLRLNVIHLAFTPHSETAPGRLQHAIRKCRQACDSPQEPELPAIDHEKLLAAGDRILDVNGIAVLAKEIDDPYLTKSRINNLLKRKRITPVGNYEGINLYQLQHILDAHKNTPCVAREAAEQAKREDEY